MTSDAPRPRRWFLRAPALIAAGAVALVVAALIVPRLLDAEAPAWRDVSLRVYPPVLGRAVRIPVRPMPFGWTWLPRLTSRTVTFDAPGLLFRLSGTPPDRPAIVAPCGCRFGALDLAWDGESGGGAALFPTWPRRATELDIDLGDGRTARVPNPFAAAAPPAGEPGPALPVTVTADGGAWIVAEDEDPRYLLVRATGASGRPVEWAFRGAVLRDASGNETPRAGELVARQHRLWLPVNGPYALCRHEPWWELTLDVADGTPVTARFRPPGSAPR